MKVLSIRQPWAWLIVNGHKDVENRTWDSYYRGPLLIHASSAKNGDEYMAADRLARLPGFGKLAIVTIGTGQHAMVSIAGTGRFLAVCWLSNWSSTLRPTTKPWSASGALVRRFSTRWRLSDRRSTNATTGTTATVRA